MNFPLAFIYTLFLLIMLSKKLINFRNGIIISLVSCNRFHYLNSSIQSITKHIKLYEKDISSTIIHFDQGTPERDFFISKYNIYNYFLMNPSGYAYSFQLLFSYVYTDFILVYEEDWVVIDQIEKKLKHKDFIYKSMKLLSNSIYIYGLYLRQHWIGPSYRRIDKNLNITYYEVYKPVWGCCYTNGASLYKVKYIKRMDYGESEYQTTKECIKKNYHIGYIIWEYENSSEGIEYPFKHIGLKSTKKGTCKISLY